MTPGIDLQAYLARIGCRTAGPRSLRPLSAIHAAHTGAIAFENLDVLMGKPIALDLRAIERKLVHERRGGYCYEQHGVHCKLVVPQRMTPSRRRPGGDEMLHEHRLGMGRDVPVAHRIVRGRVRAQDAA